MADYYDDYDYRDDQYDPCGHDNYYDLRDEEDSDNGYDDYSPGDEYEYYEEEPDDDYDELIEQMESLTVGTEYKRFGYFECTKCSKTWRSANVVCEYKGKEDGKDVFKVRQEFYMYLSVCVCVFKNQL